MKNVYFLILFVSTLFISNISFAENSSGISTTIQYVENGSPYDQIAIRVYYAPLNELAGRAVNVRGNDANPIFLKKNETIRIPPMQGFYVYVYDVTGMNGGKYTSQSYSFLGSCHNFSQTALGSTYSNIWIAQINNTKGECHVFPTPATS